MPGRLTLAAAAVALALPLPVLAQATTPPPTTTRQNPPVPRPFPGVNPPPTSAPVIEVAAQDGEVMLGNAPIYPAAEKLDDFDAGQGQRFYLFGTNLPYEDIVNYYRARMRNNGREIFEAPAMRQWELGRFDDNTMAYPPSIVVKDYSWNGSAGYLHIDGTTEKRYRTIIQVVPPPAGGGS